eukprot:1341036-Prymnesium_polylepis.1
MGRLTGKKKRTAPRSSRPTAEDEKLAILRGPYTRTSTANDNSDDDDDDDLQPSEVGLLDDEESNGASPVRTEPSPRRKQPQTNGYESSASDVGLLRRCESKAPRPREERSAGQSALTRGVAAAILVGGAAALLLVGLIVGPIVAPGSLVDWTGSVPPPLAPPPP